MGEGGPPPASVRDDLSVLGLCAMYECAEPAETTHRRQPPDLGGLTLDVPLCGGCAVHVRQEVAADG